MHRIPHRPMRTDVLGPVCKMLEEIMPPVSLASEASMAESLGQGSRFPQRKDISKNTASHQRLFSIRIPPASLHPRIGYAWTDVLGPVCKMLEEIMPPVSLASEASMAESLGQRKDISKNTASHQRLFSIRIPPASLHPRIG
jgi:predicted SPOUT superfamily RNA methylase MTH1